MEISSKFAYLPNGIIRHIIAYTGATYKKRNGKYMGQISKNDIRYLVLLSVPNRTIWNDIHPTYTYFSSSVILTRTNYEEDRFDLNTSVYFRVFGFKYSNDSLLDNKEYIDYEINIIDWEGNRRNELFEYYRYDEKRDKLTAMYEKLLAERDILLKQFNKMRQCWIISVFATTSMFIFGLIIE